MKNGEIFKVINDFKDFKDLKNLKDLITSRPDNLKT